MKNQAMTINLLNTTTIIDHKTGYGSLNDIFQAGNQLRMQEGKKPYSVQSFLKNKDVQEHIALVESDEYFPLQPKGAVYKTGQGGATKTVAHVTIMLLAAQKISTRFHYEFNKKVILSNIFEWRDLGGENFKVLNIVIDSCLPNREGLSNVEVYIDCSIRIRNKVFGIVGKNWVAKKQGNIWNSEYATAEKQEQRNNYESKIITFLEMELVRDWEHLKELINKL
jgi:hypothetical protein